MNQKERTERDEQLAKGKGLVKIHPWVPKEKAAEALKFCKALRDKYELERK